MIAGASWVWWAGFHAVVAALLVVDAFLARAAEGPDGAWQSTGRAQIFAWLGTALFTVAAACFMAWTGVTRGRRTALEFVAGYAIESSLSVDNLFVFLVLFRGFQISLRRQHKALLWGVWGAILLRALFISTGVTLLEHFGWVNWVFGLLLVYAAWRLVRGESAKAVIPEWIRRLQPAKESLLPVILAVEFTDLLFATDSIPAVLAVTHDPFVAYTSNIAAILSLRCLYLAVAAKLDQFRYLHYGLGALLAFTAFKMLAARWIDLSVTLSLAIIGAILAVCAVVSAMAGRHGQALGDRQ
jgi:tellurite resistance protein TerC